MPQLQESPGEQIYETADVRLQVDTQGVNYWISETVLVRSYYCSHCSQRTFDYSYMLLILAEIPLR